MKRLAAFFLAVIMLVLTVYADDTPQKIEVLPTVTISGADLGINARSCLLMEEKTGEIMYAQNEHDKCSPASLSKIMTMLLAFEAIESGKISLADKVTCSKAVASKPGSRVFLSENEEITVDELFKCIAVASGNDAACAMAEHIAGSESAFVELMNKRAKELDMNDTEFQNCTGLDEEEGTENTSTAYDISIMARELMKHEKVFDYTTIWTDSIRNGEFQLANTNKLVRYYSGTTGLKTGSTDKAKYCICATAKRDGMHLLAIVMGAQSTSARTDEAKKLLDYGFANFACVLLKKAPNTGKVPVLKGKEDFVNSQMTQDDTTLLIGKSEKGEVKYETELFENITAPVEKGQKIGIIKYYVAGREVAQYPLCAERDVERVTFLFNLKNVFKAFLF